MRVGGCDQVWACGCDRCGCVGVSGCVYMCVWVTKCGCVGGCT